MHRVIPPELVVEGVSVRDHFLAIHVRIGDRNLGLLRHRTPILHSSRGIKAGVRLDIDRRAMFQGW